MIPLDWAIISGLIAFIGGMIVGILMARPSRYPPRDRHIRL